MRKISLIGTFVILLFASLTTLSWTSETKTTIKKDKVESTPALSAKVAFNSYIHEVYESAGLAGAQLDSQVFRRAVIGYYNLKKAHLLSDDKQILSVVDFTKSSKTKRLWIIDLASRKLLLNSFVAHGQGSGDDLPTNFSNFPESHQSSVGFFITNSIYVGKHGRSLKLEGLDEGFNTNALSRSIVVHGAEYVSQAFINQHGRLGRSYGCPAVPVELISDVINTIKGKTCFFINGPAKDYKSSYLNENLAELNFASLASL